MARISSLALIFILSLAFGDNSIPNRCFKKDEERNSNHFKDLEFVEDCAVGQGDSPTILVSLLDGSLIAMNKLTGSTKWKLHDEPVVKSPYDQSKPIMPAFLPDPKDGALYVMGGNLDDPIKKLPFTIPELVAASPSRTTDGILYSGKKVDTWLSVNRLTGIKQGSLSTEGCMDGNEDMCPASGPGSILIGRTEYNIMMYDTRTKDRRWNITYYDYSSNLGGIDVASDYELAHFTDSSTGALITLDKLSGSMKWEQQFSSPVVAMYQLTSDTMANIPFTSVSVDTLNNLMDRFQSAELREKAGETKLLPTLYVGEHQHGLFAVPSFVDEKTKMISPSGREGQLLIEGPNQMKSGEQLYVGDKGTVRGGGKSGTEKDSDATYKDKSTVLIFGYYQVPGYSPAAQSPALAPFQITTSQTMFPFEVNEVKVIEVAEEDRRENQSRFDEALALSSGLNKIKQFNTTFIFSRELLTFFRKNIIPKSRELIGNMENKEMKLAMVVILLTAVWFIRFVKQQFKKWEKGFSSTHDSNSMSKGSVNSVTNYEITASPVELPDGSIKVGNISFSPHEILGKGCEGTFVYKGRFDNRDVAVKRVLAACFSIADREVDLLRESDEHPNVVRYFCMEQCRQFRYIALELCIATLQDVVEGNKSHIHGLIKSFDSTKIFRQAVMGLEHLHHLDIAHRDIKPQNVLISVPGKNGEIRAMISDFGLCKKLKVGRMSFSRRSGVAGTEGWIAPEMLLGHRSTTCKVDIFSVGCVYYYLLTKGKHPFGENFHRQANILSGKQDLSHLNKERENLRISLIEKALSFEPADRPPASALLKHPAFWSKEKILNFLQEVSDRVDKEEDGSAVLASIERHGLLVTNGNWFECLDQEVRDDLRKHRTYRGKSVRDLLRAIRNKKHHFRELTEEAKALYGNIPGEFSDYWCSKFPKLLIHSYTSMQCVKYENNFMKYYDKDFDFVPSRRGSKFEEGEDVLAPKFMTNVEHNDHLPDSREEDRLHEKLESKEHSLVSNWSQLDSGTLILPPEAVDSSPEDLSLQEDMQPCYRDNPNDKCENEPSNHTNECEPVGPVIAQSILSEGGNLHETCDKNSGGRTHNDTGEVIVDSPPNKENLQPIQETKKKNKKRRKHQKKKKDQVSDDIINDEDMDEQ